MISSSSWTLPAHAAMFTGLPETVHGAVETDRRLSESCVTLAERFKSLGYATVGFFSGPTLHPAFGLGQGFETYVDCTSYPDVIAQVVKEIDIKEDMELHRAAAADITGPRVYQNVHNWLKTSTS